MWVIFQEDGQSEMGVEEGEKGEGGKEKMRLIPSPVICFSPSFTRPRVSAPVLSTQPRIESPISLYVEQ